MRFFYSGQQYAALIYTLKKKKRYTGTYHPTILHISRMYTAV